MRTNFVDILLRMTITHVRTSTSKDDIFMEKEIKVQSANFLTFLNLAQYESDLHTKCH